MLMLSDHLNAIFLNLVWPGKYEQALEIALQSLEIDRTLDELDASVRLALEANASIHTKWFRANLTTEYLPH